MRLLILIGVSLSTPIIFAQGPTAESVAVLFEAYAKEREATKAPPAALAAAEALAKQAETARSAESWRSAARLIRDARWALPAAPVDLADGVRMLGHQRLRSAGRVSTLR